MKVREYYSLAEAAEIITKESATRGTTEDNIKDIIHFAANGKINLIVLIPEKLPGICFDAQGEIGQVKFKPINQRFLNVSRDCK